MGTIKMPYMRAICVNEHWGRPGIHSIKQLIESQFIDTQEFQFIEG